MTSSDILTKAAIDIFTKLGQVATFTPEGGSGISCHVNLERDVELQPGAYETEVYAHGTKIEALLSEITNEPNRGDVFTVGAQSYTVQTPILNDGIFVKVQVV
jgi:hypothetical protein